MNDQLSEYDGIFNTDEVDDLDKEIARVLSQPTLVSKMKKKTVRKKKDSMSFSAELERYWFMYALLFISAMFTGTLGVYMGLAPIPTETGLYFQTDIMHLFLAFVYMVAFIATTEGAFILGKRLFFTREEDNNTQRFTMLAVMFFSGFAILGTGISGGLVIASNIAFLTEFVEVPEQAQKWIIVVLPALFTIYTFLVTGYHLSSSEASSERMTREKSRALDLDYRTRRRSLEQIGESHLQQAELRLYMKMVSEGRLTAAQARAAMRAGKTLGQLEVDQNRDIDGINGIGNNMSMPVPAFYVKKEQLDESKNSRRQ